MEPRDVMQRAADHCSQAEALIEAQPSLARLHVEFAKNYVAMARETRIGNNRGGTYRTVEQKIVVPIPPVLVEEADASNEFGGDDATSGGSEVTPGTTL